MEGELEARPYQVELLQKAMEKNIIVCLGTGTGKTFISVLLIKELSHQIQQEFVLGGKRTFFLVNTVPLVMQQKKVIDQNTDLSVGAYVGEMGVDFWNDEKWAQEVKEHQVLVMTAQIFVDLLGHARICLSQVNLIVFDECHHAKKEHPYAQVMKFFDSIDEDKRPRILGLTASIVNGKIKPYKIESEITQLERVLRAACETSSDKNVEQFATKPKERQVQLDHAHSRLSDKVLEEVLLPWQDFILDYRKNGDAYKDVKNIVKDCIDTTVSLGISAAKTVAELFLKCIDSRMKQVKQVSKDFEDQLLIEYAATQLRHLQRICNSLTDGEEHLSGKVLKLVDILKQYADGEDKQNKLCGIVFVQRRYTADLLSNLLNQLAKRDPQLSYVKCNFVVGHGTVANSAGDGTHDMNWKKQEGILRKFRSREFNLLIATSVVEEGLDVPKCNLVVRFDFPKTYQSYIQSRGRARAKQSQYIIFTSSSDDLAVLEMYHAIKEYLEKNCKDRQVPSDEDSTDAVLTDLLPPYRTSNRATLRTSNSLSILNRYCSKLPRDSFTPLNAEFTIAEIGSEAFQATVILPINSPIKEKIEGEVMQSKQQAKMAAAYKACKMLHKQGELDDNLLPVQEIMVSDDEETGGSDQQDKIKRGTKRSREIYDRKVPDIFRNSLPEPNALYYLYVFKRKRPDDSDTILKFGIVLNTRLPKIRPFVVYPEEGETIISVTEYSTSPSTLSGTNISLMSKFNIQLISKLLRIPCERKFAMSDGYFIVPLTETTDGKVQINFDELHLQWKTPTKSESFSSRELKAQESIIIPNHRPKERFVVERVCRELNPQSLFPDQSRARTYADYFSRTYSMRTNNKQQPLILVKRFPEKINFLVPRKKVKREIKEAKREMHFITEHCSLEPFPASILLAAAELPSILHRLTSLLLVREVKNLVAENPNENTPGEEESQTPIGKANKSNANQLRNWFYSSRDKNVHDVDTYLVLQALTTKSSGDAFNLERLEMLGDAFLKQAVSIWLYCCYQNRDEGKLTRFKVKQISNLNLFKVSRKKELPLFMQNTVLDCKTWLPPCLEYLEEAATSSSKKRKLEQGEKERCSVRQQCISDKAVADSIEALIGAYLVSCGYQAALKFLSFLGIKALPDRNDISASKYANFEIPRIKPLIDDVFQHQLIKKELKGFEDSIQYVFKDKMYLLQALTHASYRFNVLTPDCYQRLEFLGDAVLDFLVTEYLYSGNPKLSPGQLTDLRQALVNNNIFAKIAVKYNYHKYLKYSSPDWFKKINDFVQQLDDDRKEGKPEVDDDPFVILSLDSDGAVEAPKVLGDIFESVAGAVFLDSGMDIVKTWQVYYCMMKPYIDHYCENVPLNPIRLVHEKDPNANFSDAEVHDDKIFCDLTVSWGVFTGKGANKKFAKLHAARLAMDAHQKQKQKQKAKTTKKQSE